MHELFQAVIPEFLDPSHTVREDTFRCVFLHVRSSQGVEATEKVEVDPNKSVLGGVWNHSIGFRTLFWGKPISGPQTVLLLF